MTSKKVQIVKGGLMIPVEPRRDRKTRAIDAIELIDDEIHRAGNLLAQLRTAREVIVAVRRKDNRKD